MKTILWSLVLVAGLMFLLNGSARADSANTLFSLSVDYWMAEVDGEVKSSDLGLVGSQIDFVNDLGLEDSEELPALKASLDLPFFPELIVSWFEVDTSATNTLTKDINFNGETFTAGSSLNTDYTFTQYEGLIAFGIFSNEAFKIAPLLGVKYFDIEASLKDSVSSTTVAESIDGPLPVIGLIANISLPANFRIEGIGRGMALEVDDTDAQMFDLEAILHYDLGRFVRASVGYRYFILDAEDRSTTDSFDMTFSGPYIGVTGSF